MTDLHAGSAREPLTPDTVVSTRDLALLLDVQLNWAFGESFAPLIGRLVEHATGLDLLTGLSREPNKTLEALADYFQGEEQGALIFEALASRLRRSQPTDGGELLLSVIANAIEARALHRSAGPDSQKTSAETGFQTRGSVPAETHRR